MLWIGCRLCFRFSACRNFLWDYLVVFTVGTLLTAWSVLMLNWHAYDHTCAACVSQTLHWSLLRMAHCITTLMLHWHAFDHACVSEALHLFGLAPCAKAQLLSNSNVSCSWTECNKDMLIMWHAGRHVASAWRRDHSIWESVCWSAQEPVHSHSSLSNLAAESANSGLPMLPQRSLCQDKSGPWKRSSADSWLHQNLAQTMLAN